MRVSAPLAERLRALAASLPTPLRASFVQPCFVSRSALESSRSLDATGPAACLADAASRMITFAYPCELRLGHVLVDKDAGLRDICFYGDSATLGVK